MAEKNKPVKRKAEINYDYLVRLYDDGKYHWLYDLNMLKNPSVLIDVYKMLGMTIFIMTIILLMIMACADGVHLKSLGTVLKIVGLLTGIMLVLGLLGYLLYAALTGWVYTVHFILDEKSVEHLQAPRSQKTAKRIGALTILAGLLSRKPGVMGSGMLAASHTSMTSHFSRVKKVKAKRWMNTIMVNEPFAKNRVYVSNEDFDFVFDYISSHCPKAKVS